MVYLEKSRRKENLLENKEKAGLSQIVRTDASWRQGGNATKTVGNTNGSTDWTPFPRAQIRICAPSSRLALRHLPEPANQSLSRAKSVLPTAGHIRHTGWSSDSPGRFRRTRRTHPPTSAPRSRTKLLAPFPDGGQNPSLFFSRGIAPPADFVDRAQASHAETRWLVETTKIDAGRSNGGGIGIGHGNSAQRIRRCQSEVSTRKKFRER